MSLLLNGFGLAGPTSFVSITDPNVLPMLWAYREALKGRGRSNPNPSVGCILLDQDGVIVGKGHTQPYGGAHAERLAFDESGRSRPTSAYITLEPCHHIGRQPPCTRLFLGSSIQNIYVPHLDLNPLVFGMGAQYLHSIGIKITVGILRNELIAWNSLFLAHHLHKRPILSFEEIFEDPLSQEANTYRQTFVEKHDLAFTPEMLEDGLDVSRVSAQYFDHHKKPLQSIFISGHASILEKLKIEPDFWISSHARDFNSFRLLSELSFGRTLWTESLSEQLCKDLFDDTASSRLVPQI